MAKTAANKATMVLFYIILIMVFIAIYMGFKMYVARTEGFYQPGGNMVQIAPPMGGGPGGMMMPGMGGMGGMMMPPMGGGGYGGYSSRSSQRRKKSKSRRK